MAGGSPVEVFNAGAYNATRYAKQGDLGSKVLAPRPTGTVWELGGVARASTMGEPQLPGACHARLAARAVRRFAERWPTRADTEEN